VRLFKPGFTVSSRPPSLHRPVVGVVLKLGSIVLLAVMAACVKGLGTAIPSGETIFVRGIVSVIVLALIAWRAEGLHLLKTANWRSHALRSLSGTTSMFCWFIALTLIPFADFTAISFTAPMFVTILAMLVLGERIHRYRWTALAIGFVGVLIMIGPHLTFRGSSVGVFVALAAAAFSAVAMMFLRSMSVGGGEHAITITFYFSATSMVVGGLTALWGWPMPTAEQWLLIGLVSVFGVLGQLLLSWSYRYAEASTIAPLDYTNLLLAVILGYVFFGERPHLSIWIGAPLVIAAGWIILWREYRRSVAPPPPLVTPNA
jgi:drug/metabolite transporter (DMT)-like permease